MIYLVPCCFFFQAEDGIRDLVRSRGLGDVYKRQVKVIQRNFNGYTSKCAAIKAWQTTQVIQGIKYWICLLYTSDAADERSSVDLGGRRIIKKKKRAEEAGGETIIDNKK